MSIEWSSGIETLKCIARVDLSLNGSFADMILIPNIGASENNSTAALFILTNPGQLHVYDGANLSILTPELEAQQFPVLVPTDDPCMTISKIGLVPSEGNHSKALLEVIIARPTLTLELWTHSRLEFNKKFNLRNH